MSQTRRPSLGVCASPDGVSGPTWAGKTAKLNERQAARWLAAGKEHWRLGSSSLSPRNCVRLPAPDPRAAAGPVQGHYPLILVTGANGYIGSHVVLELLKQGQFGVVAIDSLVNSSPESLRRVRLLAAQSGLRCPPIYFHQVDIRDRAGVEAVFRRYQAPDGCSYIRHVIHFAALKSVERSRLDPGGYYSTNVAGTAGLLDAMHATGVRSLVFSSSAVVYGARAGSEGEAPGELLAETACPVRAGQSEAERMANYERLTNPYGKTKLMCEEIIHERCSASNYGLRAVILRYTNPSGNDASGLIGDSPAEVENLMPIAAQVLQGLRGQIAIYGTDYRTRDGTGVRDFIHVQDLARGHLSALNASNADQESQETYPNNCRTYNLGTGKGASVKEVLKALMEVSGKVIATKVAPRRAGDLAVVVCDPSKAERELGWKAERDVIEMARDLWTFCMKNPNGLETPIVKRRTSRQGIENLSCKSVGPSFLLQVWPPILVPPVGQSGTKQVVKAIRWGKEKQIPGLVGSLRSKS